MLPGISFKAFKNFIDMTADTLIVLKVLNSASVRESVRMKSIR